MAIKYQVTCSHSNQDLKADEVNMRKQVSLCTFGMSLTCFHTKH